MNRSRYLTMSFIAMLVTELYGCGGGGDGPAPTYTIGGSVAGLVSGASVTLQDNGGNNTPVSVNSSFSFSTPLATGAHYAVTVSTQPTGEVCAVANGSGTVGTANISVAVTCTPNDYTIGGSVSGLLPGNSVSLVNNGTSDVTVSANGAYTFSSALASGSTYAVTAGNPPGQTCSVTNGSGTVAGANITNVTVACSAQSYQISVTILGSANVAGLVLQNNGGDNLSVTSSGTYTFSAPVPSQKPYAVSILTQPGGSTCFVNYPSGTVAAANVSVNVGCPWHVAYYSEAESGTINAYYIDQVTGAFFFNGAFPGANAISPVATVDYAAAGGGVDPSGRFLYMAIGVGPLNLGEVFAYAINPATGALTAVTGSPFQWDAIPTSITIDPAGEFLYTANGGSNNVSAYSINTTTGALTEVTGSPFASGVGPGPVTINSNGTFLYTGNGDNTVSGYSINAATGALTPVTGSPFAVGNTLLSATVNPNGKFIYAVIESGTSTAISVYDIDAATGALGAALATNVTSAASLSLSPAGNFLYWTAGDGSVSVDSIDSVTGAPTPLSGSPFASSKSSSLSSAVLVDPSGTLVYSILTDGLGRSSYVMSGFTVDSATGALTPAGISSSAVGDGYDLMAIAVLP